MNEQLFIPKKIKVGYQERKDTYTKKLAYVIYYDSKGALRKEKSWEGWRDKKIDSSEFDNSPTEGFVLNKKVGGYKSDWNHRATYARVFDPRGFEFEISVPNLLYILQETDCTKGKGLIGEFVYAWDGKDLILLPAVSEEYRKSTDYSALQGQKVGVRELIAGAVYETKKQQKWIYLGRYNWHETDRYSYHWKNGGSIRSVKKSFIFANEEGKIEHPISLTNISRCVSDTPVDNYAELLEKFTSMAESSKVIDLSFGPLRKLSISPKENDNIGHYITSDQERGKYFAYNEDTNDYSLCKVIRRKGRSRYDNEQRKYVALDPITYKIEKGPHRFYLEDGALCVRYKEVVRSWNSSYYSRRNKSDLVPEGKVVVKDGLTLEQVNEIEHKDLFVTLENGNKYEFFKKFNIY